LDGVAHAKGAVGPRAIAQLPAVAEQLAFLFQATTNFFDEGSEVEKGNAPLPAFEMNLLGLHRPADRAAVTERLGQVRQLLQVAQLFCQSLAALAKLGQGEE